ncbi:MAG: dephospho-CoA kinase [Bacteroides sp.]|nr:dephospho-CoA kinase [Bacteroides sp.]
MEPTVFNPAQQQILRMLSFSRSEESMEELKKVLFEYYSKQVQEETDLLWDEGVLDEQKIEDLLHEHLSVKKMPRRDDVSRAITGDALLNRLRSRIKSLFE